MDARNDMLERLKNHRPGYSLDQAFYTDPDFFKLDMELIWYRDWLFIGHDCELPRPAATSPFRSVTSPSSSFSMRREPCAPTTIPAAIAARALARPRRERLPSSSAPTTSGPTIWTDALSSRARWARISTLPSSA